MSEKNDKLIKNSEKSEENKVEEITGEDVKELKDAELEQSTGGWFPIFDECPGHFEERYCLRNNLGENSQIRCPQLFLTENKFVFNRGYVQYGSCKKGCFGNRLLYYEADFFFKK